MIEKISVAIDEVKEEVLAARGRERKMSGKGEDRKGGPRPRPRRIESKEKLG